MIAQTKEELKAAMAASADRILVRGQLAKRLYDGKNIVKVGRVKIPFLPIASALPIAVLTGLQISFILAVSFVGVTLLLAVWRGYDVSIKARDITGNVVEVEMRRKRKA